MRDTILRLIQEGPHPASDGFFNAAALQLFEYQFSRCPAYRQFSLLQKKEPGAVQTWEEIPFLPVMAFKMLDIACRPLHEAKKVFRSSGTTGADKSRHHLFDPEISKTAILSHFKRHLMPEIKGMRLAILTPSPDEAPDSSLSHMMETILQEYGTGESRYYIERGRLQAERLAYDLAESKEPICLLGTSFSFVHFIDFHEERSFPRILPKGSRLMDTGGFKGKSREVSREWIYAMAEQRWGIPPENCVNEYGMAEMTSQFYDRIAGREALRVYSPPPQVRTRVLSPETLQPIAKGEIGLLAHLDLANIDSVAAILTEDIGREIDGGFLLIGRAAGAAAKGCSLTLDDLLERGSLPEAEPFIN
jgi:hypothetical protein